MKTKFHLIFIFSLIFFVACKKPQSLLKPEIQLMELGYFDTKTAFVGADFYAEANLFTKAKIKSVSVEVYPESKLLTKNGNEQKWLIDSVFAKFDGLVNAVFHEHFDIPLGAEVGVYQFVMTVTDWNGNTSTIEEKFELRLSTDTETPVINITQHPVSMQTAIHGTEISISGTITDDIALGKVFVALVRNTQNLTDEEVNVSNTITLFQTHSFDDPRSISFNASIIVGAFSDNALPPKSVNGFYGWQSGEHYLLVKTIDAFGGNIAVSARYPIVVVM